MTFIVIYEERVTSCTAGNFETRGKIGDPPPKKKEALLSVKSKSDL